MAQEVAARSRAAVCWQECVVTSETSDVRVATDHLLLFTLVQLFAVAMAGWAVTGWRLVKSNLLN